MSETTSFLGGAAFAGLATLILLKGGISNSAPSPLLSQPQLTPFATPSALPLPPTPVAASPVPTASLEQQTAVDKLKLLLEQQRTETERLKAQLQSQQTMMDSMLKPAREEAAVNAVRLAKESSEGQMSARWALTWALSGIGLTFGVGICIAFVFALLGRQKPPPPRTVEVIHSMDELPYLTPSRRRSQLMPARRVVARRVEVED